MKKCPACGEEKPTEGYNRNRSKPDGLQTYCRECEHAIQVIHRRKTHPETKRCRCCQRVLHHSKFCKHPHMRDGLQSRCKVCCNENRPERRESRKSHGLEVLTIAKGWGVPEGWNEYVRCARNARG